MKYIPRFLSKPLTSLFAVNLFLFMNACSEDITDKQGDEPLVEFSFMQSPVETRATIGEDGNGTFTDGDEIDLYTRSASGAKHFLLTIQDGQWKSQMIYKLSNSYAICI